MTLAQAYKKQFGKVSFPFRIYDADGNKTYAEHSNGFWIKYEYDSNGDETYVENSVGYWWKCEYDTNGNKTYYESRNTFWPKRDKRKSSCEGKVVEVDGKKYKLKEL